MKIEKVKKLSPIQRLLYWVAERENIRVKKETGETELTNDVILQKFRFCNVVRRDDTVSQWLINTWYIPYQDHPNIVVAATLARQLNNTQSLGAVGFPAFWQPKRVERILNSRVAKGLKNFSPAYMITGTLGGTKIEQIVHKVVTPIHDNPPKINSNSMEESVKALLPYSGFSTFIAGQVVADLRWAMSGKWKDKCSWAPIGPGSKKGCNLLHGRDVDYPLKQAQFTEELQELLEVYRESLPGALSSRIEAQDAQSTMCEFSKYEKALWGRGRPKQLYRGGK